MNSEIETYVAYRRGSVRQARLNRDKRCDIGKIETLFNYYFL